MGRYRRPILAVFALIWMVIWLFPYAKNTLDNWMLRYQNNAWQQYSKHISKGLVYPVKSGEWVEFSMPAATQELKIVSNAHINPSQNVVPEMRWKYRIRYQLLDQNGQILIDRQYHFQTRLSMYMDDNNQRFYKNYYAGYGVTPLDGRLMKLSMDPRSQRTKIRVMLISDHPDIKEAAIRLYIPRKVSDHRLGALWLRMSEKQKHTLAKGSVYPYSQLTEIEKKNLLSHQWQALGPDGVEGKDYHARTLYMLSEVQSQRIGDLATTIGLHVNAQRHGVIPIAEQGGHLTLRLTQLDGSPLLEQTELLIEWFGRLQSQRWQKRMQWSGSEFKFQVQGGLIKISSASQVLVQANLLNDNQENIDITPRPLLIHSYAVHQGVYYKIHHVEDYTTPMRVDVRQLIGQSIDLSKNANQLKYQWFNDAGDVLETGSLMAPSLPSQYDQLQGVQRVNQISDPSSYYFNLPANVSRIRFFSEHLGILVNVYNQPIGFQKFQRIPESSFTSSNKKEWYPAWFKLKPEDEQTLIKNQQIYKVSAQYRPPENNPIQPSEAYIWEDFIPLEQSNAHYLLTEIEMHEYRDQALSSRYCSLPTGQAQKVNLQGYGGVEEVTPHLLYLRTNHSPFTFSLYADEHKLLDRQGIGQQGQIKLSKLKRGEHQLTVNSQEDVSWVINQVKNCSTQLFVKRRAFGFVDGHLTFEFENKTQQDKVLVARLFIQQGRETRSQIKVAIEPFEAHPLKTIQEGWTFTHRLFDVRHTFDGKTAVLYQQDQRMNSGEVFFIPINKDMQKGRYWITFKLEQGTEGLLMLSRINKGLHEQWRFYRETKN